MDTLLRLIERKLVTGAPGTMAALATPAAQTTVSNPSAKAA
ncbi:hypothetical protein [Pandoraea horticolens]|nr:hypothetical protein [Pandoraea horticolens]